MDRSVCPVRSRAQPWLVLPHLADCCGSCDGITAHLLPAQCVFCPQPVSWKMLGVVLTLGGAAAAYVNIEKEKARKAEDARKNQAVGKPSIGGPFELVGLDGGSAINPLSSLVPMLAGRPAVPSIHCASPAMASFVPSHGCSD